MGSTWVTVDKRLKWNIPFISDKPDLVWHQFVPGVVTMTTTNVKSDTSKGKLKNINSIMARSHYDPEYKKSVVMTEENRYYPLLRGVVDVPEVGDPVLLCTFGNVQYYLGPLNTEGNPTQNKDYLDESVYESNERNLATRLQKKRNKLLDNPKGNSTVYENISGDLVFEGRYGNSMRIGSRNSSPHIIISNGRYFHKATESTSDGSILGMFTKGSVRQHLPENSKFENNELVSNPFMLASDIIKPEEERKRLMSYLISHVNNEENATKIIYDYGKLLTVEEVDAGEEPNILGSQMFLNSDRIVINSKSDSLFLSSAQNIHIGAANTLTISTEKETIVESSNIYLGRQAKETAPSIITGTDVQQGLILGENLREWLDALVDILISANGHCQGAPIPLGAENGPPGSLMPKLTELKNLIIKDSNDIVSIRHFIEDNKER